MVVRFQVSHRRGFLPFSRLSVAHRGIVFHVLLSIPHRRYTAASHGWALVYFRRSSSVGGGRWACLLRQLTECPPVDRRTLMTEGAINGTSRLKVGAFSRRPDGVWRGGDARRRRELGHPISALIQMRRLARLSINGHCFPRPGSRRARQTKTTTH